MGDGEDPNSFSEAFLLEGGEGARRAGEVSEERSSGWDKGR